MAIKGRYTLSDLLAYWQSRIAQSKIVLLWLLCWLAWLASSWPELSLSSGLASSLRAAAKLAACIISFRLLDDLADRPRDAIFAPSRVLVRSQHTKLFLSLSALLLLCLPFLANLPLLAYFLYLAGLLLMYWATAPAFAEAETSLARMIRVQCVLMKYPCFVLLILNQANPPLWPLLVLYLLLTAYDHAPAIRGYFRRK